MLLVLLSAGLGAIDVWPPKRVLPLVVEAAFPRRGFVEGAVVEPDPDRVPVSLEASPVEDPPPNTPPDGVVVLLPKRPPEAGAAEDDEVRGLEVVPLPVPRVLGFPKTLVVGLPKRDVIGDSERGDIDKLATKSGLEAGGLEAEGLDDEGLRGFEG